MNGIGFTSVTRDNLSSFCHIQYKAYSILPHHLLKLSLVHSLGVVLYPHRHALYYKGLSTVATKTLTPTPIDLDVIYGRPLTSDKVCHADDDSIAIEFENIFFYAFDRRRHFFTDLVEDVSQSTLGVCCNADDVTGK